MMYSYYLKYSCCGMNVQTCNLCCVKIIVYLFHLLIIKSCHFSGGNGFNVLWGGRKYLNLLLSSLIVRGR